MLAVRLLIDGMPAVLAGRPPFAGKAQGRHVLRLLPLGARHPGCQRLCNPHVLRPSLTSCLSRPTANSISLATLMPGG